MKHYDVVYESKLVYRTKQYGDQVRTFCMNPYGHVVAENVEGINTVNGHSYSDPKLRSENTNFALLVSNRFTSPFNEPYRYGKHIASLSNMLAGGVLVQRFGDLVSGIRTNEHRMSKSFVHPTLTAAVPGDLSLALPKRQLDDIIEMIYQLDKLAPGTANYDTLLYGAEVKFYSARLALSNELETALPGFFAVGDGAGVTRGLAQAGASGEGRPSDFGAAEVSPAGTHPIRVLEADLTSPENGQAAGGLSPAGQPSASGCRWERRSKGADAGFAVRRNRSQADLRRRGPGGRVGREGRPSDFGAAEVSPAGTHPIRSARSRFDISRERPPQAAPARRQPSASGCRWERRSKGADAGFAVRRNRSQADFATTRPRRARRG